MARNQVQFGSFLDEGGGDRRTWLIVIPVVVFLAVAVVWAGVTVSRAGTYRAELERAKGRLADLQRSLDERDQLLVQARADEALMHSAGQATGIFFGVAKDATESGVAIESPDHAAVRVYLYGLVAPPEGQEYAIAARTEGGLKPLGAVLPSELGTGFLLSKEVPAGTSAVELVLRKAGAATLDGATPRVSARYPRSASERGILLEAPATPAKAQARRGRR